MQLTCIFALATIRATLRRLAVSVLLLAFAALGSGALLHVHNLAHAAEHADAAAAGEHHPIPLDTSGCDLHGKLAAPAIPAGFTPVLIALGLFVAFLTQLTPAWNSTFAHVRLDCRGPPVC
jgi:hypothetical protein